MQSYTKINAVVRLSAFSEQTWGQKRKHDTPAVIRLNTPFMQLYTRINAVVRLSAFSVRPWGQKKQHDMQGGDKT
jgi:hypothetical protein